MNEPYLAVLGRARPVAIHGKATSFTSDPETGRMHIEADAQAAGETLLCVLGRFGTPSIGGENASLKELKRVGGGFRATVEVEGRYAIRVSY